MRKSKEQILVDMLFQESKLHQIKDFDILLEYLLTAARSALNADAGSIYVIENKMLAIKYAQNDTLSKQLRPGEKLPFVSFKFPLTEESIAGYVAKTGKMVNETDVYNIAENKNYKFDATSDIETGYKTVSNLALPLTNQQGDVVGVLQILNAKDEDGNIRAFDSDDEIYLKHFANNTADALGHASLTRSIIMRMARMSELRDPSETGMHIKRVSSYAVEIYDRWAFNNCIPETTQAKFRDKLKIAALLHDIGKVAIPDKILKKSGELDTKEYETIKSHTWIGAQLFMPSESKLDEFISESILRHHENWDGSGYPGKINLETGKPLDDNQIQGLKGEEIPLAARIIALADVYDALSCKRSYKEAWPEEDVISEIKKSTGIKFDPAVVKAFFEVYTRIKAIKEAYTE